MSDEGETPNLEEVFRAGGPEDLRALDDAPSDGGQGADAGDAASPSEPQGEASEASDGLSNILEGLRTSIDSQNQLLQQTRTDPQQGQDGKAKEPEMPAFNFQIPQDVLEAANSDDPQMRARGLTAMLRGVAAMTYRQVQQELVDKLRAEMTQAFPQYVQMQMQQARTHQNANADFYGKFPQLDRPELRPVVQAIGQRLLQANPNRQWDEAFRDEIGNAAMTLLAGFGTGGDEQQTQTQTRPANGRPPVPPRQSTGRSGGQNGSDEIDAVWNS